MNIVNLLKGKKTYIIAGVVGILVAAKYLGCEVPDVWFEALGVGGLMTLRAGVAGSGK